MVRATTSFDTVRHDLKSLPGGWVELRPMTYGQFLQRRDMGMKMAMRGSARNSDIDLEMVQTEVTRYEFSCCIADHNLEDENGRKMSLGNKEDFDRLDPRVGQEITQFIDDMNQWENPKSSGESSDGNRSSDSIPVDITQSGQ